MPIGLPVSASFNRRCEFALARVVRMAAEGGAPFEELLSRSPFLEKRLLDMTFDRIARAGRSERGEPRPALGRLPRAPVRPRRKGASTRVRVDEVIGAWVP